MRTRIAMAAMLAAMLSACAMDQPQVPEGTVDTTPPSPAMPGSDRDAHGCIPSAGYGWCASTNRCERPWELARAQGFATTQEAFDRFCGNPAQP